MQAVTIFHNPACGTSRNVLAMIRASGVEPEVIEYLRTPPSREQLLDIIQKSVKACAMCCVKKLRPIRS